MQLQNIILPVGDADANVTYAVLDKQNGVVTWREVVANRPVMQMERITASITRPGGKRKNYDIEINVALPCLVDDNGAKVYSHSNYIKISVTVSPKSTNAHTDHAGDVVKTLMQDAQIQALIGGLEGLY